jgi:hypothetical protein
MLRKPWTEAESEKVLRMVKEGKSYAEIGRLLGRSPETVSRNYRKAQEGKRARSVRVEEKEEPSKLHKIVSRYVPRDPVGATGISDGLFYKKGAHGRLYYYCDGDWLLSTKRESDIRWRNP